MYGKVHLVWFGSKFSSDRYGPNFQIFHIMQYSERSILGIFPLFVTYIAIIIITIIAIIIRLNPFLLK